MIKPYAIYIAYVSWGQYGKRRPVLVFSSNDKEVAVFKITSKFENKSAAVRAKYVEIVDWAQAGLLIKSYIDISKIIDLPLKTLQPAPIGKLTESDLEKLLRAMNE